MNKICILVDDLPRSCYECEFHGDFDDMGDNDCFFLRESVVEFSDKRHNDCPLSPVWVASYKESGIIKP